MLILYNKQGKKAVIVGSNSESTADFDQNDRFFSRKQPETPAISMENTQEHTRVSATLTMSRQCIADSAHDISAALVENGADVTMLQVAICIKINVFCI